MANAETAMGIHGLPTDLITNLMTQFDLSVFVETGTHLGHTARWASGQFAKVVTIERSESLYTKAREAMGHISNLEILRGDTREVLPQVLAGQERPCLLWLDAHWSGGETFGQADECPLLDEIRIVNQSRPDHFILIDDARLFTSPPPRPHRWDQWPEFALVMQALTSGGADRYVLIHEDVLIAVPGFARAFLARFCQEKNTTAWETASRPSSREKRVETPLPEPGGLEPGEIDVIERFVPANGLVFDVGGFHGAWSFEVLRRKTGAKVHLFEPLPSSFAVIAASGAAPIGSWVLEANAWALGRSEEIRPFYAYAEVPSWSTFHRRWDVEREEGLMPPVEVPVPTTTLDLYCQRRGIRRIDFLKIDAEGDERNVLMGADRLLRKGMIDFIQFEYGGTFRDAGCTLKEVYELLASRGYFLIKIRGDGLFRLTSFSPAFENYQYANFLAVNERLRCLVLRETPRMLDIAALCRMHSIRPSGVIQVGAHEGQEIGEFIKMGAKTIVMVEANPSVYERLRSTTEGIPNAIALHCAVSDETGTAELRVTSMDQSSSILPLKLHKKYYPDIVEAGTVRVPAYTLEDLVEATGLGSMEVNILSIDVQGAELRVLRGAEETLKKIDAVNVEVNYEELYEGGAFIWEIDEFLEQRGFERVATTAPFHPTWGDALYAKKPVVSMSSLGSNGRFGNQLFQYAFLRLYAQQYGLCIEVPEWVGEFLFGLKDRTISAMRPEVREEHNILGESAIVNRAAPFRNVDFWGYFQYHTRYYRPWRSAFRSFFRPRTEIRQILKDAHDRIRTRGKTLVGIHIRRGDYGQGCFFKTPSEWYKEWLSGFWETLDSPILFLASDEVEDVAADFREYSPVMARELGVALPEADFYPDFYMLTQCDYLAISNSSFSFAASMLNETAKGFFRPSLSAGKLVCFDPWDSPVLLVDEALAEPAGSATGETLTIVPCGGTHECAASQGS